MAAAAGARAATMAIPSPHVRLTRRGEMGSGGWWLIQWLKFGFASVGVEVEAGMRWWLAGEEGISVGEESNVVVQDVVRRGQMEWA